MPPVTAIQTFIQALQTGRTKTTEALDALFENTPEKRNALKSHPDMAHLRSPHSLDSPAPPNIPPGWWRSHLGTLGDLELDHIDKWPNELKENVRVKLVQAIDSVPPQSLHFFWEMHRGDDEKTAIEDPGGAGDVIVTFRSPGSKLSVKGQLGLIAGRVKVSV